jgi:hypothetical protein
MTTVAAWVQRQNFRDDAKRVFFPMLRDLGAKFVFAK